MSEVSTGSVLAKFSPSLTYSAFFSRRFLLIFSTPTEWPPFSSDDSGRVADRGPDFTDFIGLQIFLPSVRFFPPMVACDVMTPPFVSRTRRVLDFLQTFPLIMGAAFPPAKTRHFFIANFGHMKEKFSEQL